MNEKQLKRYSRQILMPEVGKDGQEKLLESKVLIIGAGGLGSAAIQFLASAGVGFIGIADGDVVDVSNLQRQTIHAGNVGMNKAESAKKFVEKLNEDVKVKAYPFNVSAENSEIVKGYDIVLDCTDNIESKFLINDICIEFGIPYIHASVVKFMGEVMTVLPKKTACYRCLFKEIPKDVMTAEQFGVISAAPGVIGSIQAVESLKFLLNIGELLTNRMLYIDLLSMEFFDVKIERDANCPVCGEL